MQVHWNLHKKNFEILANKNTTVKNSKYVMLVFLIDFWSDHVSIFSLRRLRIVSSRSTL